jgi:hypothetical protein
LVVFIFWVQVVKSTTHVWFSNLPLPAGRHSGFHTENGRYGSAGHRGEPSPFGSIPPLESGIARKFDRDFYPGSGCAVANTGFSNGPGLDHRSKDSDERHKRESFTVSGDGRDGGSSAVNDQPVRPYHSQVLSEVENSSWERDRSKGLISSGSWDSSQRSERDHRERLSGKPDSYSRREGKFSQYDAGRDWSQGDRDLDGSRLDRYGSSSRDGFSSDTLGGTKDSILGFDWRRKERSSSVSASRTSTYAPSNGGTKENVLRPQGLDVSGSISSPQHSPHSTPSSTVHDPSRDDGNQPSPPKRPRLGWGQGLAKYEKKKVVETDEISTPSPGFTVSESGRSIVSAALSGTTTETLQTQELHAAEESPVSVVSNPSTSPALTPTTSPLQQALESTLFCFPPLFLPPLALQTVDTLCSLHASYIAICLCDSAVFSTNIAASEAMAMYK